MPYKQVQLNTMQCTLIGLSDNGRAIKGLVVSWMLLQQTLFALEYRFPLQADDALASLITTLNCYRTLPF